MLKKPKIKVSLLVKVACIFLVVGVAVCSLGFVLGPSGYLYFDHGLKTGNSVAETSVDEETAPFNQIVLEYSYFNNIRIETGNAYRVEIKSKTPYFTPKYTVKGGVLTLTADVAPKKTAGRVLELTSNGYDSSLVITVPENAQLALLDIQALDEMTDYFSGYTALFSGVRWRTVTLSDLHISTFSCANDASLNIENCTIGTFTRQAFMSYKTVEVRASNSAFTQVYMTMDNSESFEAILDDCTISELQADTINGVTLSGGSVGQANITSSTLDCTNVQFADLTYDVYAAKLSGCTAEVIDGTADDRNEVSLVGNMSDYALDLQASPAIEVIEKTVDYTDPLYVFGYDTPQTENETATVSEDDANYENLYENNAYISENTEAGTRQDGSAYEKSSLVVYKTRTLRYFVQNGTIYYDVGAADHVSSYSYAYPAGSYDQDEGVTGDYETTSMAYTGDSVITMTHDVFEQTLAEQSTGGVYVNGTQANYKAYQTDGPENRRIRLVCTSDKVSLTFTEE